MIQYTTHPEKFNWTNLKAELLCFLVNSLFLAIAISFCLLISGCSVTKTIPIETIRTETKVDTIYLNTFRFDSTYVSHDLLTDRSRDTIFIKETNTEIRYKLLRDTVERVKIEIQRDSIPYEVHIETIKEVPRPRTWFDHLSRSVFWIVIVIVIVIVAKPISRKFT